MWSIILVAKPKPESPDFGAIGGAFATVFVVNPHEERAQQAARALVENHDWEVEGLDSIRWVELENFECGSHGRELYEQAMVDGICAAFYRWPLHAPDADDPDP